MLSYGAALWCMSTTQPGYIADPAQLSGEWATPKEPTYYVEHDEKTYSFFVAPRESEIFSAEEFGKEIAFIYSLLCEGQEPLGAEFEAVWDANIDSLYEA